MKDIEAKLVQVIEVANDSHPLFTKETIESLAQYCIGSKLTFAHLRRTCEIKDAHFGHRLNTNPESSGVSVHWKRYAKQQGKLCAGNLQRT